MTPAVFLLSAAVLAHEVVLLRVLSVAHWHHAAAMVLSVALLGFGASGTLLALAPRLRGPFAVSLLAAGYALLVDLVPAGVDAVGFNVLEVGWDPDQWFRLLALQGLFFVPFLVAATAVGAAIASRSSRAGPVYGANLLGSGAGAVAAPFLLEMGDPSTVLTLVAGTAAVAAIVAWGLSPLSVGRIVGRMSGLLAAFVVALTPAPSVAMSPYKALPSFPDRVQIGTWHGPQGRVDLVAIPSLHHAPGLSLVATRLPESQEGLFVDGHLVGARDRGRSDYLDDTVGALPFVLLGRDDRRRTLLLGVGPDLARATTVVEADADLLAASGAPGAVEEPRAWLRRGGEAFDAVLHHVSDLHPVAETPLLTVEGVRAALERAKEDGVLAISCAVTTPPRGALKLLATADRVTSHVVAIRSNDRLCVALRRRALDAGERARVAAFCEAKAFDVVRPVDLRPARPRHAAAPLDRPGPDYPYDVSPATDARPYFHKSFLWSRLGDSLDHDRVPFVQWGYVALLVAFAQVTALCVLLVVAPLATARAARSPALLFATLGAAFMALEMAYLQRATLRIGSPVHAAAAVLGGFLVGAGLGSLASEALGRPLRRAAVAAAALAPLGYLAFPSSVAPAALVCAAVAFPLGVPFPAALARLPGPSVPWALAWNGCASVFAAAAAPLLSSTLGIPATLLAGAAGYACVALLARFRNPPGPAGHP